MSTECLTPLVEPLAAIRALVQDDLHAVDRLIEDSLKSEISLIPKIGHHLIDSGGKRLRPLLVLLGAHAFSYQGTSHFYLAAIIELIHTVTLLHDDVVDMSELRRGKSTANAVWGNAASVLVGDYLYSRAFQMMVQIENIQVLKILAQATNTISEGEILQLLNCKNPNTTEAEYMNVIRAKTGALFATATQMGALLCDTTPKQINAMIQYGMHLGIAFQLVDDALDYSSSAETLGKNQGDDLAEGKPTLPLLYALSHGTPSQQEAIRTALLEANRDQLDLILDAIESTKAIPYTYQQANKHAEQAIQYLNDIPASRYREALIALAKFAVERIN